MYSLRVVRETPCLIDNKISNKSLILQLYDFHNRRISKLLADNNTIMWLYNARGLAMVQSHLQNRFICCTSRLSLAEHVRKQFHYQQNCKPSIGLVRYVWQQTEYNSTYRVAGISQHWEETPNNEWLPCLHFNLVLSTIFVIAYSFFTKIIQVYHK